MKPTDYLSPFARMRAERRRATFRATWQEASFWACGIAGAIICVFGFQMLAVISRAVGSEIVA